MGAALITMDAHFMRPTIASAKRHLGPEELQAECVAYYGQVLKKIKLSSTCSCRVRKHVSSTPKRKATGRPQKPKPAKSLAKLMQELQFREVTPEDYELLLQLDESVARKTLTQGQLDALPTVTLEELRQLQQDSSRGADGTECGQGAQEELICLVCHCDLIEDDDDGDEVAHGGSNIGGDDEVVCIMLPRCKHRFHYECLAGWLLKSSTQCPCCRASVLPV